MNVHLLIDAVVRQTTILLAQMAVSGGARAALGHTANQVFIELTSELRRQGLNNKLIADLFGLSLRTYHNRVRRLSESLTDRGKPLWNAVLDFVQAQGVVTRGEVLMRFCRDEDTMVKSVLNDLVELGIVFSKGRGDRLAYRAASCDELGVGNVMGERETRETLVWILVARHGPLDGDEIAELSQLSSEELQVALAALLADDRIRSEGDGVGCRYSSSECLIPQGQAGGWEASVFDHYQAVVTAICAKLAMGATRSEKGEQIGGSTYSFEVWPGHPLQSDALALLSDLRERAASLRRRVDEVNKRLERPQSGVQQVVAYVGQNVIEQDTGSPGGSAEEV